MTFDPKTRWTTTGEVPRTSKDLAALGEEVSFGLDTGTDEEIHVTLSGTFVGTVQLQTTLDGTNYSARDAVTPQGGGAAVVNMTAPGTWIFTPVRGLAAKVKATAWTSGTVTVAVSSVGRS